MANWGAQQEYLLRKNNIQQQQQQQSLYPRVTALPHVRVASPFRGNGGLPYYRLLSIPLPAFPPYVVATTHTRGTRTIALKQVSTPFSHLAQSKQKHSFTYIRGNKGLPFLWALLRETQRDLIQPQSGIQEGIPNSLFETCSSDSTYEATACVILQNGGHNCQEGATITR